MTRKAIVATYNEFVIKSTTFHISLQNNHMLITIPALSINKLTTPFWLVSQRERERERERERVSD